MAVICFDLWNTLIQSPTDSDYEGILVGAGVCQTDIYPFVCDQVMNKRIGSYAQIAELVAKRFGVSKSLAISVVKVWEQDNTNAQWMVGSLKSLRMVAQNNRLVLISNVTQVGWQQVEERLRISVWFEHLVLSWERGMCKPNPMIWTEVSKQFPEESSFWMVGDSAVDDIHIPKKLGWRTVRVGKHGVSITQAANIITGGV